MATSRLTRTFDNDWIGPGFVSLAAVIGISLFQPSFTATSPGADGAVTVRTLDEFYGSQARGFARAAEMSETLEHVVIERSGRLATAWADFVFRQDGTSRRGRLVLALVETKATWRIASVMFSY